MNVSGLVVRVRPEALDSTLEAIVAGRLGEVYTHDGESKIVVVVEAKNSAEEVARFSALEAIPGVVSVELAYTYSEELEDARDRLERREGLPEVLKKALPAEKIRYGGDVRQWLRGEDLMS